MSPTWIPVDRLPTSIGPRADVRSRPYLWFVPSSVPGCRGTLAIGWPERWWAGHLHVVGANFEHDEQPSHFADCFGDDFADPERQLEVAKACASAEAQAGQVVHSVRRDGVHLLCTSQPRGAGDAFARPEDDELVTCPGCLVMLKEAADLAATVERAAGPPILPELPVPERIAAALERIADYGDQIAVAADNLYRLLHQRG